MNLKGLSRRALHLSGSGGFDDASVAGGLPQSSDEGRIMGLERRGGASSLSLGQPPYREVREVG